MKITINFYCLALVIFFGIVNGSLSAQTYQWAGNASASGNLNSGNSIVTDNLGNVYVAGFFTQTADFDPGVGTASLSASGGNEDIFIAKYGPAGNYIWAKRIGGTFIDKANSIALDNSGHIFITGFFSNTTDFDPGAGVANLISTGSFDIFMAKYDTSGNYIWAKRIGNANSDNATTLTLDNSGHFYIIGMYKGVVDFDPGAGIANLNPGGSNFDVFFAKYDTSGNYIWAKGIGGTLNDNGFSITVTNSTSVYIAGSFGATVDFDPGAGTSNLISAGNLDLFFAKYDTSGNYIWAKNIGDIQDEEATDIALDQSENIFLCGYYTGTVDFDPGAGLHTQTDLGNSDLFFAKYDSSGNYVWAKSIGSANFDNATAIQISGLGNVFLTGNYQGTADFNPGAGIANLTWLGVDDIFIAEYDSNGNYLTAKGIGSTSTDQSRNIFIDGSENIYITGLYTGTVDFDPGAGVGNLTAPGNIDVFYAKYHSCSTAPSQPVSILGNTTICNGSSNTYSVSSIAGAVSYTWTLPGGWTGTSYPSGEVHLVM